MNNNLFNSGDYCLNASLWYAGMIMCGDSIYKEPFFLMTKECRLLTSFHPIKSAGYRWSNSGSENPEENNLKNRPTWWLYHHVLKYFKIDPHKGLSTDQMRALFIVLYLKRDDTRYKKIWWRIFWGYIFRLGMTPSLMEWAPLKPQAYVLFWKCAPWFCYPIYKVCEMMFSWRFYNELENVPIKQDCTNKISAIPTAHIIGGYKMPSREYIKEVYQEYFKGHMVGISILEGLLK